jgi:hypothetical protein
MATQRILSLGSRVFSRGKWHDLRAGSYREQDYERIATRALRTMLPDVFVMPFKCDVHSPAEDAIARPDLAFVWRDYSAWGVVEVELASHSLELHVIPQVRIFSSGSYGELHVKALMRANSALQQNRLQDLVAIRRPLVWVVVDSESPMWKNPLHAESARLTALEVYDSAGEQIIRLAGDALESRLIRIGRLFPVHGHTGTLRFDGLVPAAFAGKVGKLIRLMFAGRYSTWKITKDSKGRLCLISVPDTVTLPGKDSDPWCIVRLGQYLVLRPDDIERGNHDQ